MGNINNKEYLKTNKDKVLNGLKIIQFNALKEIDRICKKYNITYSLSGGTCLGAIRDKGIIPWDDDIDIEMMRDQYEKFMEVAPKELDPNTYYMLSYDIDKNYHSSTPKLMIKGTQLRTRFYIKRNYDNPICVDFFIYDYVPNDPKKRKKVTTKIYNLRTLMLFKWFGVTPRIPKKYVSFVKLILKFIPFRLIHYLHDSTVKKYGKIPSDWILETAVVNGNYGGMPVSERKEHIEVEFENQMFPVMKGYDTYLRRFFGNSYMKWLPPEKRVSHHKWSEAKFGRFVEEYNLDIPKDYEKYLIMKLNSERLEHVKKLSLDMLDEIKRICDKNNIDYFITGDDAIAKAYGIENEYSKYWRNDMSFAMTQENFKKFDKVVKSELAPKYFYQSRETEDDYKLIYPKIRLNNSIFRDNKTVPADINTGLWINIVILAKTSNNENERKKHYKKLKKLNSLIKNKWLYKNLRILKIKSFKGIISRILLIPISIKLLYKKQEKLINKYNDSNSEYYVDISGNEIHSYGINKKFFEEKNELEFLGHKYNFPSNINEYVKHIINKDEFIEKLKDLKKNNKEKYNEITKDLLPEHLEKINKRVVIFSLGIYDHPDYLLSAIFAKNEEIESATLEDLEQPEYRKF